MDFESITYVDNDISVREVAIHSKVLPQFSPEGLAYQGEFQQIHSPHSRDLRKLRNHKNPTEVQEDDTTK
ncbi:hypothetical protein RJ639_041819 [Escallonia herrerae]|uniref:Uncharacterized protein n=1 Tax=Escallonia herrerae TaxID=1293975 RepID=A0AA89B6N8_9ASTE|nr:hypothetical protein RJ639_041819 [Escallonia herrerae]